ncbi:methyltransferase domain-containing protein [Cellulophaga baltica]|uniref:methyltransferase domain-containing protein n=1 Tax=Cellulophaga baltica TaxID=76594 RepID=UPI000411C36B|nr:methyltransferase domain-containing protein [Cellulophaga baltica]AIY14513.1 methyltransferase [Cellulophaga baltica NN016038]
MLINLSKRSNQPELMDSFDEPIGSLELVFQDINSVNNLLGGNNITIHAIQQLMDGDKKEHYTIVDMGCGDGNMLKEVALYFRKRNVKASFIGIDLNKIALEIARKNAKEFPEISFLYQDILTVQEHELECDILINTLTMHHFTDDQVLIFLKKFTKLAQIGVVINDLQRSSWAYYLFHLFSAIFIKTRIAKIDGLISIRRAFIKKELESYAKNLPKVSHDIQWKWAFRYLWVMKPIKKVKI